MSFKLFIIIPVRNRSCVTSSCLAMIAPLQRKGYEVVVIDDGSSDDTVDVIRNKFPEVSLILGSGDLYWTGAIERGMRFAIEHGADCCVLLNDDLKVECSVIEQVVDAAMAMQCLVSGLGKIDMEGAGYEYFSAEYKSFSGLSKKRVDESFSELIQVDSCRGNLLAVPRVVIESIGYPDGVNIPHQHGDTDYSLRATRAGYQCYLDPQSIFLEEEVVRDDNQSWLLSDIPLSYHVKQAFSKRGVCYPRMLLNYYPRHWGVCGVFMVFSKLMKMMLIVLLRLLFPLKLRLILFSRYSKSYQFYKRIGS